MASSQSTQLRPAQFGKYRLLRGHSSVANGRQSLVVRHSSFTALTLGFTRRIKAILSQEIKSINVLM
jgi:hypothetical protein